MMVLTPDSENITIKYSDLDNYYIECLSLHRGTGDIIINVDGTYSFTCADGHAPSDTHPIKQKQNPFIREN